jgi:hypothetical protein
MPEALTLSESEVRAIIAERYPYSYSVVLDSTYNVPTQAAIEKFNSELGAHLLREYGDKWQTFFDCENFSLEAVVLSCRKHWIARRAGNGSAQGVALGLLCYRLKPGDVTSGHCACFWIDAERTIHEFEPQNRQVLPLTDEQRATVFFVFLP